jgi:predicted transposase/invertase (TIGR01784 family)
MVYAIQKRGKGAPLKAYAHALFTAADPDVMKEVKKKMATSMELFEIFRDVLGFDKEWEEKVMEKGQKVGQKVGWEGGWEGGMKVGLEKGQKAGQKKGVKEGVKKGVKKGAKKAKEEMAKNLLDNGVSPEVIAKSAGLSLAQIQGLMN